MHDESGDKYLIRGLLINEQVSRCGLIVFFRSSLSVCWDISR